MWTAVIGYKTSPNRTKQPKNGAGGYNKQIQQQDLGHIS